MLLYDQNYSPTLLANQLTEKLLGLYYDEEIKK